MRVFKTVADEGGITKAAAKLAGVRWLRWFLEALIPAGDTLVRPGARRSFGGRRLRRDGEAFSYQVARWT